MLVISVDICAVTAFVVRYGETDNRLLMRIVIDRRCVSAGEKNRFRGGWCESYRRTKVRQIRDAPERTGIENKGVSRSRSESFTVDLLQHLLPPFSSTQSTTPATAVLTATLFSISLVGLSRRPRLRPYPPSPEVCRSCPDRNRRANEPSPEAKP